MATHPLRDITNVAPAHGINEAVAELNNTRRSEKLSFFEKNNIPLSTPPDGLFDCSNLSWVSGQEQSGKDKIEVRFASIPADRFKDFEEGLKKAGG